MLFWPILLMLTVGLGLAVTEQPLLGDQYGEEAEMRLVYLVILTVGLFCAGLGRAMLNEGWRTVHYGLVWSCVFAGLALSYSHRDDVRGALATIRGETMPSVALNSTAVEVVLDREWDGHYRADARVNGVAMPLMVDTGASMVVLPFEQVERLGFRREDLDYSTPVMTANGRSTVASIKLNEVSIGDIVVRNVTAAVAHPGKLHTGLLGMSFLDRLNETSFQGTKLYLRQSMPEPSVIPRG